MYEVVEFVADDGHSPFGFWFEGRTAAAAVRVRRALGRMELGNLGDHKPFGQGCTSTGFTLAPAIGSTSVVRARLG